MGVLWVILSMILYITIFNSEIPLWTQFVNAFLYLLLFGVLFWELNEDKKRREKEQPRPLDDTVDFSH